MANIGERITSLRKSKKLSQTELAESIKASREAIGKYERNESSITLETAKKIVDVLGVSLDSLVDEAGIYTFDKETLKRIKDIELLNEKDKAALFIVLDAFLRDSKARKAYLP